MNYSHIIATAVETPWAIAPAKLKLIEHFLARKARGEDIPEAEIQAAKQQGRARGRPASPGGVGLIQVFGTITQRADLMTEWSGGTSTEAVGQQLDQLAADESVSTIIIEFDSPGGSVYGVAELGAKIAATTKTKKVIGVVNSMAASGAYWLASQVSELVVTDGGQVGSIGVYLLHLDESQAMKAAGVNATFVSAGERKVAGNSYGPLDAVGREEMQTSVDDYYRAFVAAVAKGRNTTQTAVREGYGRGGMVRAQQAVREGMADRIGTLEATLAKYGITIEDVRPAASRGSPRGSAVDHEIEIRRRRLELDQARSAGAAADLGIEYHRRLALIGSTSANRAPVPTPQKRPVPVDGDPWRTCYHEAGHGVVAYVLGAYVLELTAVPGTSPVSGDYFGRADFRPLADPVKVAAAYYAGVLAEPHPQQPVRGSDAELIARHCPDRPDQERGAALARSILAERPEAVRLVAEHLFTHGTMTHDELAAIVGGGGR